MSYEYDIFGGSGTDYVNTPNDQPISSYQPQLDAMDSMNWGAQMTAGASATSDYLALFFDDSGVGSDLVAGRTLMDIGTKDSDEGFISGFLKSMKDNPEATKMIAGIVGGVGAAMMQQGKNNINKQYLKIQKDELALKREKERRAATSMHGVTVPGMGMQPGLINTNLRQPQFNPNINQQLMGGTR